MLHRIAGFALLLRHSGVPVSSRQLLAFSEGMALIGIRDRIAARDVAIATLGASPAQQSIVARLFDPYWLAGLSSSSVENVDAVRVAERRSNLPDSAGPGADTESASPSVKAPESIDADEVHRGIGLFSSYERLRFKDFARYSQSEIDEATRLLFAMDWTAMARRSRRFRSRKRGRRIDLTKLLRRAMQHGGELTTLPKKSRMLRPRRLVILCDFSGSMERYSRMLLHFAHAVNASRSEVEAFVFSTRLTRVTHLLDRRSVDASAARVAAASPDRAGGTRIGAAIGTFNRQWARRAVGHGALVLILSDGWDRGDPRLLSQEMARLHRTAYRVIWLNPLLGFERYQPVTRGMQAALPHIDQFLAGNTLANLEDLAAVLTNPGQTSRRDGWPPPKRRPTSTRLRSL